MTAEPKRINWPAARAYFLALPAARRTYAEVARRFKCSDVMVGQIAKREGWREQAEKIERRIEQRAITEIVRNRAERLARTLSVFDRASDLTLALLPIDEKTGELDPSKMADAKPKLESLLSSMPGLFKMA